MIASMATHHVVSIPVTTSLPDVIRWLEGQNLRPTTDWKFLGLEFIKQGHFMQFEICNIQTAMLMKLTWGGQ